MVLKTPSNVKWFFKSGTVGSVLFRNPIKNDINFDMILSTPSFAIDLDSALQNLPMPVNNIILP